MRVKYIFLFSLCSLFLSGCETAETSQASSGRLTIATWNVQTLFDGEESGYEYPDYSLAAGWTSEKYQARLNGIADAIGRMVEKAPDIIALIEVENAKVLEDLITGPLAKQGYRHSFFGGNRNAALGIGIISRFPFEQTLIHSITSQGETSPRPVLEARFIIEDKPLVLFACHWKSKADGEEKTEPKRKDSARVILRRLREIRQEGSGIPVIVMGDLNENHDEFFRLGESSVSALMPDDPKASELAEHIQTDFLIISPQKPPQATAFNNKDEALALYSPWWNELIGGSYNYKDTWETIDHFLLSAALFNGSGWDFDSCALINKEPFVRSNGKPYVYSAGTGNGLSDHLPLVLTLTQVGETVAAGSSAL
ncbi:MAG: endonuclease/exonuclease/phosphatase family protein [Treponema sp.]|jgi:endonuclease/exonuclease/phosphatase family metal-dependent hydrolase|nr:endonuclease/exonuclease/phosphatase family protein [Treponema sp.]